MNDKTYHHGNLKDALVEGYIELLHSVPHEKLSLRKLAGHVGVAPAACYNHFKNKEELIVAVKTRFLCHFANYLDEQTPDTDDSHAQICELGKAYFNYSILYPQKFNLIMGENIGEEFITEELLDASMRAEGALRATVIKLLQQNDIPVTQYNEGLGAFACWSVAHGITSLASKRVNNLACAQGKWPPEFMLGDPDQVRDSFCAMADILVAGILAAARK